MSQNPELIDRANSARVDLPNLPAFADCGTTFDIAKTSRTVHGALCSMYPTAIDDSPLGDGDR